MEGIPEKIDSKFRFILLAAHRAEQMMRGARPKVESEHDKVSRVAVQEVLQDRVNWDYGPAEIEDEVGADAEVEEASDGGEEE